MVEEDNGNMFRYRLNLKVVTPKTETGKPTETKLELKLSDYRATVSEQTISLRTVGGGMLDVAPTGLPLGLEIVGPQGPIWLPMLAFYYPDTAEDGDFSVAKTQVGSGIDLIGTGTLSHPDKKKPALSFEMSLIRGQQVMGKVSLTTTLDDKGWPQKVDGTLKSADGTYHFTLQPG